MSTSKDFDGILEQWLQASGPQDVPGHVVEAALSEVRTVGQRRGWLRLPAMPRRGMAPLLRGSGRVARLTVLAVLSVTIVAVVVGGIGILVGQLAPAPPTSPPSVAPGPTMTASSSPLSSPLPSSSPAPRPSSTRSAATSSPSATLRLAGLTTITATGKLRIPRSDHLAVRLADGRVLIVGGSRRNGAPYFPYGTAELYDPATRRFSATGSLVKTREVGSATTLRDGRVLVTLDSGAPAELYDPANGTFTETGTPVLKGLGGYIATLLQDGRVLITGGQDLDPQRIATKSVATALLYDPGTGTFEATGPMASPRVWHTATLLTDGRVLVAGGNAGGVEASSPAELYDPQTRTFSVTGDLSHGRAYATAALLTDGRVLVAGGGTVDVEDRFPLAWGELYDPITGTFSEAPSTPSPLPGQPQVLPDGRVLLVDVAAKCCFQTVAIYDPPSRDLTGPSTDLYWSGVASTTVLADGDILVAGGAIDDAGTGLDAAFLISVEPPPTP